MAHKYQNAISIPLGGTLLSGAGSVILESGKGALLGSDFPLVGKITKFDTDGVTVLKREIVNITNEVADVATITRSYETCPLSSTSSTLQQVAQDFDTGDILEVVLSKKCMDDIEATLISLGENKLDKSVYNVEKEVFAASVAGDDDYEITSASVTSYVNGQTFKVQVDVANTGPATLKLNALTAKSIKKIDGGAFTALETGDIIANQIFWATYNSVEDIFQFSVDPANVAITVPDADETTKGIVERDTDAEALGFVDTTRYINAYQLGLATPTPEQDVPYAVGAVANHTTQLHVQASLDGTVLCGVYPNAANTSLTIFRMVKENNSNQYIITHTATLAINCDSPFCIPCGNYLYVGFSASGTKTMRRYDLADLANVTSITVSGAWTSGGAGFSDNTYLYIYTGTNDFIRYSISGTTITSGSTFTYTDGGYANTGGACCDGTNVWICVSSAIPAVIRKYALAGGAVISTTNRHIMQTSYGTLGTHVGYVRPFIPKKNVLALAFARHIYNETAQVGSSMKIQATILP